MSPEPRIERRQPRPTVVRATETTCPDSGRSGAHSWTRLRNARRRARCEEGRERHALRAACRRRTALRSGRRSGRAVRGAGSGRPLRAPRWRGRFGRPAGPTSTFCGPPTATVRLRPRRRPHLAGPAGIFTATRTKTRPVSRPKCATVCGEIWTFAGIESPVQSLVSGGPCLSTPSGGPSTASPGPTSTRRPCAPSSAAVPLTPGLKWIRSFWNEGAGELLCIYSGPPPPRIREHSRRSAIPCDDVREVTEFLPSDFEAFTPVATTS